MTNNDLLSLNTLRKSLYVNKVIAIYYTHTFGTRSYKMKIKHSVCRKDVN